MIIPEKSDKSYVSHWIKTQVFIKIKILTQQVNNKSKIVIMIIETQTHSDDT